MNKPFPCAFFNKAGKPREEPELWITRCLLPGGGGCAHHLQTFSTASISQQVMAVSRTGTFAPPCSLVLSGCCFTHAVISEAALLGHSICPPSFCSPHLSPFPSPYTPLPPPDKITGSGLSLLCGKLAQPFVSFFYSCHAPRTRLGITVSSQKKRTSQERSHAWKASP